MTGGAEAAATAALDRRLDPSSRTPLAVAVSGGGDSMALLHLVADWAARAGRELRVLTVDHGLHADAAAWARLVTEAAAGLASPAEVLGWTGLKPATGLPGAARAARHALLADAARRAGARVILLGHTKDDLVEAGAMRAAGSTVGDPREWSPSPAWPEGRGVFLLRPLLALSRESLRELLRDQGACWIEDPANADLRFARARARLSSASPLAEEAPVSDPPSFATRTPSPAGGEGTPWGGLRLSAEDSLDPQLLSAAVLCASGGGAPPRGVRLTRLAERLRTGGQATLAGARVVPEAGAVLFGRDPGRAGLPSAAVEPGREQVWDGRFAITSDDSGAVGPLAGRAARLNKAERAALRSVPAWVRPTLPVLETASGGVRLAVEARPLALERLRAACGVYTCEADLPPP